MDKIGRLILAVVVAAAFPSLCWAAENSASTAPSAAPSSAVPSPTDEHVQLGKVSAGTGFALGGACVGAGVAAVGGGYGIARVGGHCIDSMARQPEAASSMFAPMIVTAAMIEGAMLFAIVIALLVVLRTV